MSTQRLGLQGFPTLAMVENSQIYFIANGYTRANVLEERLHKITTLTAEAAATKAAAAATQ
jgi:protein-disulfide isomerase-like protein with CxxC motif